MQIYRHYSFTLLLRLLVFKACFIKNEDVDVLVVITGLSNPIKNKFTILNREGVVNMVHTSLVSVSGCDTMSTLFSQEKSTLYPFEKNPSLEECHLLYVTRHLH